MQRAPSEELRDWPCQPRWPSVDPEQVSIFPHTIWNSSLGWSLLPFLCPPSLAASPLSSSLQLPAGPASGWVLLARRIIGGGWKPEPPAPLLLPGSAHPTSPLHLAPQTTRGRGHWGLTLAMGEELRVKTWEDHAGGGGARPQGEGTLKQAETHPEREEAAERQSQG